MTDRVLAAAAWALAVLCGVLPLGFKGGPILFEPFYLGLVALWAMIVLLLIFRRRWWWMLLSAIPALWALFLLIGILGLCSAFGCH